MRGENVLVVQANGKIIEVCGEEQKLIMNGHFAGEVWGLAVSPDGHVVTSGDDNKVLVFDPSSRRVVNEIKVNEVGAKGTRKASTLSPFPESKQSRALAINPANGNLAVATNNGEVQLFESIMSAAHMKKAKPTKDWCEIMRFSPDGSKLAVGFHNRVVYLYAAESLKGLFRLKGHSSFITNIDWSEDSAYLRTVSGAYELLYWDSASGKRLTHSVDTAWASQGRFGWNTEPLWKEIVDGSFVNCLDRSKDREYLAVGEDDGCVRIYRNPVAYKKCLKFKNHSSHVVKAEWGAEDATLCSVGGYDKTLMIHRVAK